MSDQPRAGAHREELDTPLLVDVTTITIDPAYLQAAARRTGDRGPRRSSRVLFVAVLVTLGVLMSTAYRETRVTAPAAKRAQSALVDEARRRTRRTDDLQRAEAALREAAATARAQRLRTTAAGRDLAERLAGLELAVGSVAVRGPGVEVELRDAPEDERGEDLAGEGTVRDRDIQEVVNALWAAGAEAIAVNGQRLSSLTAIREAGEAVLVDYRPVTPPYRIHAVGDPDRIEPEFTDSSTAAAFRTLAELYGIGFDVRRRESLSLPAAGPRLRYAEVAR
ncbi:MAG TPA: DUF881 domain-containing protein [Mycobacteriales bacterium]|nr:DUF881 domain-containing protein [Mycobacteriales bacterium]